MPLEIIILAAGQGKRMRSSLPKVLHNVGGKPMLQHLLETTLKLKPSRIHVVIGHGKDQVVSTINAAFADKKRFNWVEQKKQLGTGHAVMQALPKVKRNATVMVLNGDCPLVTPQTLRKVARLSASAGVNLMTVEMDNPTGLGRIVRDAKGKIIGIVEEKDADTSQRAITEVNTNCLATNAKKLQHWLSTVNRNNAQNEYYLTDAIAGAVNDGMTVKSVSPAHIRETMGANSKSDLAVLERIYQQQQTTLLMEKGVTLMDPARVDVRGTCQFGNDCVVDINVIFEGKVKVGDGVSIGPNTVIRDATIGHATVIEANCVIDNATIGKACNIGPFARIRPETVMKDLVKIGNFVETKKSIIGIGSKANHLSYVGDSEVGKAVNIGAGVITCNYDGANKHKTIIGDNVFVGSDSQLVAPVTIAKGATIGAGSTITDDVDLDVLAVSRARQRSIKNWKRPVKKPK